MTDEEKAVVMRAVSLTNAGRLPLMIGVGGNNTLAVADQLKRMDFMDYEFVLTVCPYYNKPSQEGIYQHYKYISEASALPVVAYNVPSRTGVNMSAATTLRIANDCDNVVAIKEASGDMTQIDEIIKEKPNEFHVISGDDHTALQTTLMGGSGVISVLGQALPSHFSSMIAADSMKKLKRLKNYIINYWMARP